jgi:hypothetical protein
VQRSTGIFTLVQDGGESILSVATSVPYNQATYYYNYAARSGYIQRRSCSPMSEHRFASAPASSRQPDQSPLDSEDKLLSTREIGRH